LAGTYPITCKAKYWATSSNVPAKHELGLRILIRKVQLMGMHHEKALIPILSYNHEHYYRIYFLCERGRRKAAKLYEDLIGMYSYCANCGHFIINENKIKQCPICNERKMKYTGHLYTGPVQDVALLKAIKKLNTKKIGASKDLAIDKLLTGLLTETEIESVGHYDFHDLASKHRVSIQKYEEYDKQLGKHKIVRVATNRYGFKTTAPAKEVHALFEKKPKKK